MLQINPKKYRAIKNKTIPNPLRPKFRNKAQSNIYFLSKRKFNGERKDILFQRIKMITIITTIVVGGFFLSN
tara:strand:+ start:508 stop:723 length:216 start_codon:yes stop_codon:yes gene_type:complete